METLRVIAVGINRMPMGEVRLAVAVSSFSAIADRDNGTVTITGTTYKNGNMLTGSFCDSNGTVGTVIMRKTKNGYAGSYVYLDESNLPVVSRYEWRKINSVTT